MSAVTVTPALVGHVAALARLALGPDDTARIQHHLTRLLDYVAVLERADVRGVPPTGHPLGRHLDLRADVPTPALPREALLRNAPAATDAFFLVPKVIGGPAAAEPLDG
jgi:aspartyl-tRNA(Asn)/glutamyl-tRNA(Gln) amidotransferase subunit C